MSNPLIDQAQQTIDDLRVAVADLGDAMATADAASEKEVDATNTLTEYMNQFVIDRRAETAQVDPGTNKMNKDWSQLLMDQLLNRDDEFLRLRDEVGVFTLNTVMAKREMRICVEKVGMLKAIARLQADMLGAMETK